MRDSIDRLENIKARYPRLDIRSDTGWLIAEVERLRHERADVIEELAKVLANPRSEPVTTEGVREAQQLAARRMRRACNDV